MSSRINSRRYVLSQLPSHTPTSTLPSLHLPICVRCICALKSIFITSAQLTLFVCASPEIAFSLRLASRFWIHPKIYCFAPNIKKNVYVGACAHALIFLKCCCAVTTEIHYSTSRVASVVVVCISILSCCQV